MMLLFLMPVLCQATIFTEDGTISGGTYSDVTIESTATVSMTAGNVESMLISQMGTLNHYGGTIGQEIYLQNSGTLNLEGATFQGTQGMSMFNDSVFNLNTGYLSTSMELNDYVEANINNGQITDSSLNLNSYAVTNIYDGDTDWDNVMIGQFSTLNIRGGSAVWDSISISQNAILNIYGGELTFTQGFNLQDEGEINVYYSSIIYHEYDPIIVGYRLLDNREFMLDQFSQSEIDQINFIPEPTTFLLLGLGTIMLRKRKANPS